MKDRRDQFWAFIALCLTIGLLTVAPAIVVAFLGKSLPDQVLATIDKSVASLGGVLGMAGGLLFGNEVRASLMARRTSAKRKPEGRE